MRILQFIHKIQNRGAETFACQLSNHLIKLGHEVKIVALYEGSATLPFNGTIEVLNDTKNKRFLDFKHWKKLAYVINNFQPDLVQANAGDTLKYAVFSKKLFGWKTPLISRNASEVGRYLHSPVQKKLNSFFYKNVDFIISVSMASERDILNHFPFLSGKTEVIPVGLENSRKLEGISLNPIGNHHVVHVGGFSFEKNHEELIGIFSKIIETRKDVHLHLVGDGPLKSKIEELVENMDLQEHVTFYGFVNNPLSYINAADVLVLPSIIEGLPGVLLEAMFCRTPVIAYNVGGISEIISPKTGSLIRRNDSESFANAILDTLSNPNRSQIDNAYAMVKAKYMNHEIALNFVNSYQNLVTKDQ